MLERFLYDLLSTIKVLHTAIMVSCPSCGRAAEEAANFCQHCGQRLRPPAEEQFKVVTVVFCDIVGSTDLAERLGLTLYKRTTDRFAETARRVLAWHKGEPGAVHGDGIMAVFGIPEARDDDALRGVTAAYELRGALAELGRDLQREHRLSFAVRMGVNTGRVVVDEAAAVEERISGHPVNVARRLQEQAKPGGILIGDDTYQLVRDAVRTERLEPLSLKGISGRVQAYQLLEMQPGRRAELPGLAAPMMIGRDLEQDMLRALFERVVARQSCHLVTVLGRAGVGKTRLVDEFTQELGERATVLKGVCLPYGDSVTFWPMVQIVRGAAGIAPTDDLATAREEPPGSIVTP